MRNKNNNTAVKPTTVKTLILAGFKTASTCLFPAQAAITAVGSGIIGSPASLSPHLSDPAAAQPTGTPMVGFSPVLR